MIKNLNQLNIILIFVLGNFWFNNFIFIGAIIFNYRTKGIFYIKNYNFFTL